MGLLLSAQAVVILEVAMLMFALVFDCVLDKFIRLLQQTSQGRIEENQYYLFRVKIYCTVVQLQGPFIIFGSERFVSLIFGFLSFCVLGHVPLSEVNWSRTRLNCAPTEAEATVDKANPFK